MKKYQSTAVKSDKGFKHFGIETVSASLYGAKPEDIVDVEITISQDQSVPSFEAQKASKTSDYWGWISKGEDRFSIIFGQRFLLNMAFASGIEAAEKHDRGKAYRINVEECRSE